jgi:DNA-directed RNA polymerase subunit M/transcription elongation factor TFIIS
MAEERFVVITLECPRCKTKQKVHVNTRTGFAQMGGQTIQCIRCDNYFKVTVPDRIVGGPFPV